MYRTAKVASLNERTTLTPDVPASVEITESVRGVPGLPIEEIRAAVEKVRHGSVQLIIQDGRIVQIDIVEKRRLT
jgi:hypothetical protein